MAWVFVSMEFGYANGNFGDPNQAQPVPIYFSNLVVLYTNRPVKLLCPLLACGRGKFCGSAERDVGHLFKEQRHRFHPVSFVDYKTA